MFDKIHFKNHKYELQAMDDFYLYLGILPEKGYGIDGYSRGVLCEIKLSLGASYGLKKAKKQANTYSLKLLEGGEYLPFYFIAVDITKPLVYVYENKKMNLIEAFDWYEEKDKFYKYWTSDKNIKYDVDENSVPGLAHKYYLNNPESRKIDFFDNHIKEENDKFDTFKGDEKDFSHIMDKLNDPASQKVLGAYYTPDKYVEISTAYLRNAIADVRKKYDDYVIIDRCSGTGNLQKLLTREELSHCILNTYEAKEWIALMQLYTGKVRRIIPTIYKPCGTLLEGGNALEQSFLNYFSEEFKLRDEGKLGIILLENPPFSDIKGNGIEKEGSRGSIGWVVSEMKKDPRSREFSESGSTFREVASAFIWSGFEYFKPEHYILFGPIKYWKTQHLIDKKLLNGHICDRQYFTAKVGKKSSPKDALPVIHWKNEDETKNEILLDSDIGKVVIKKIYTSPGEVADKQKHPKYMAIFTCEGKRFNTAAGMSGDSILKSARGKMFITEENILYNLPLWCATKYEFTEYTEKNILFRSGDKGEEYQEDKDFLNDCLFYTLLSSKNLCSSKNKIYPYGFSIFNQKTKHMDIMNLWMQIYNWAGIYSLYEISKEKDTSHKDNYGKKIYDNPIEHEWIRDIRAKLKIFYLEYMKPKMLEYELVK